jgi:hypothetical protein
MLIPFFILSFFIHFILADGSNVLVINSPQPNQQISSKSDFRITYTIVGGQASKHEIHTMVYMYSHLSL